jgi:5'-phosphate synthase pdxT subunit
VLALQGDVGEHAEVLKALGAVPIRVRRPADLQGLGALVLPGGESTTMSLLLESSGLAGELVRLIGEGLPMLGTCAGMILLAREILDGRPDQVCFGAIDLVVRRNAFGRQVESFETDLDVVGIGGGPMHAVFIRAPVVEEAGTEVEVLASVAFGDNGRSVAFGDNGRRFEEDRALRPVVCKQGSVIVAAFHPELAGDGRLHKMLLDEVEREGD